jgi:hypothetical protein
VRIPRYDECCPSLPRSGKQSRAQSALARCAKSLKTSVAPLEIVAAAAPFAAGAPRLRLEYQPQLDSAAWRKWRRDSPSCPQRVQQRCP